MDILGPNSTGRPSIRTYVLKVDHGCNSPSDDFLYSLVSYSTLSAGDKINITLAS